MTKQLILCFLLFSIFSCKQAPEIEEVSSDNINGDVVVNKNGAPDILNLLPSGVLPNSTGTVTLQVTTDEQTECKYANNNISFYGMTNQFTTSDGLTHTKEVLINEVKSYTYFVSCKDTSGAIAQGTNKIVFTIDSNTVDQVAPNLYNAGPTGDLADGTTQVSIFANTNENATCHYSEDLNDTYGDMAEMTTTGGNIHTQLITGLSNGSSYSFYFICKDPSGNESLQRGIAFSVSQFVLQDGATLYTTYCAYCHNPLSSSEKRGATPQRIRNGINGVGSMRALELLRDSEIENISQALNE